MSRGEQQLWSLGHRLLLQAAAPECTLEIPWDTEHADIKPSPPPLVPSIHLTDHTCTAPLLPIYIASETEKFTLHYLQLCWALAKSSGWRERCWQRAGAIGWAHVLRTTGPCTASSEWHTRSRGDRGMSKPDGTDCRVQQILMWEKPSRTVVLGNG